MRERTAIEHDISLGIGKDPKRWLKFFAGLAAFIITVIFFASGYSPPGILGEVLRHNQANDIDSSPLFYTEVENMSDLEEGVKQLRKKAADRYSAAD